METLRVGVIGAGGIAMQHGKGWTSFGDRARVTAVADVSEPRARVFSDRFTGGTARIYSEIEALVADPDVDAVDICLPHHLHTPAIVAAARAGKAILSEKPMCTSLEEAATIKAVLAEKNTPFVMAHNQLFQPAINEALRLIGDGALGTIFYLRSMEVGQQRAISSGRTNPDLAPGEHPMAWRFDPSRMGGGEVLDTGWHGTYRLLAMARSRPVEVSATMGRLMHHGLPSEDSGSLTLRFEDGSIGEMLTTWAFSLVDNRQFEAAGEFASLAGGFGDLVVQHHGSPAAARSTWPDVHTFTAEIGHFLDVMQKGAEPRAGFAEGARALQVIKGAYLSAAVGCTVSLPEDPLGAPVAKVSSAV
jgi:predicted dehydrogenase